VASTVSQPAQRTAAGARSDLLAKALEIAPILRAEADGNEETGRLSDRTLAAMRDAGMLSFMLPECFGGGEVGPVEAIEIIEALCYADGSAGWVAMADQCCAGTAAAFLKPDAANEVFGKKPLPIIAGQGAPNGRAEIDGDGYRLTGHWRYGSGTLHSTYIHTGALVYENGKPKLGPDGAPIALTSIVPTEKAEFKGNWDVMGLRATGSVDYEFKNVYVPAAFTHVPETQVPVQGGNLYRIGILGMTQIGHTGFALGNTRRALDELAAFVRSRPGLRGHLPDIADSESFHERYGEQEAKFRAARALVFESWRDIEASLARGETMGKRQITLIRLALNHVTNVAAEVCTYAYRTAGGVALRTSVIQRCFRDMHAGTQHFLVGPVVLRECGKELAGLAGDKSWALMGLVDG
jgi:alkylation response protein AidB-like acyl-CoA dehydrogenase